MSERYERLRPLGAGAMGEVFVAQDKALEREVALKTSNVQSEQQSETFLHEARVLGGLEHPHIVPVHDMGRDESGRPFMTMQYVRGETLDSLIGRLRAGDASAHEHFTYTRRLRIVSQICEALSYAHSRGVMHRDIKPANVMLGAFEEVMVVDWGLSARAGQSSGEEERSGMTPAYAAPERIQEDRCDERSEVYSVGALMYELFTLTPAFDGTLAVMLPAILDGKLKRPDDYSLPGQGRVPREIANIILKAMARLPEQRYQTPLELAEEIQAVLDGQAPVVCVHTGFKRGIYRFGRLVDNHGRLVITLSAVGLTFFLTSYVVMLSLLL